MLALHAQVPNGEPIPEEFQEIFDVYWAIGVGVFVLITVLAVGFAFVFRASRDREASRRYKNTPLELSYATFLAVVVGFLVYLTYSTMETGGYEMTRQGDDAPEVEAAGALPIDVTASRWNWRFSYPEGIVVQGSAEETPTLVVPDDRPVTLRMRSLDVIHAIWIPELRFKQDVFPGFTNTMTLTFPEAGFIRQGGQCNQFCGLRHAYMDFHVEVLPGAEFDAWTAREGA